MVALWCSSPRLFLNLSGDVGRGSFARVWVVDYRAEFECVVGIAPGDQEKMTICGSSINIQNWIGISGEVGLGDGHPIAVGIFDPGVEEFRLAGEGCGNLVAFKIFDEGVVAFKVGAAGDGGKRNHVDPLFLFRMEEVPGVDGAVSFDFGGNEKALGLAYFPIVIIEGLPASAFATEASDACFFILMNKLGSFILLDGFGIILPGVPNREDDKFFAVRKFLYAEVSLVPTGGHEVRAGGRGKDFHFDVKRGAFGGREAQVNRPASDALEFFISDQK